MSLRTFARRFGEEVGTSPGRWLIQQRVARARHLLESTHLAVDEIAGPVGFVTGTSLRQPLHAAIGVSPLAYPATHLPGRGVGEPLTVRSGITAGGSSPAGIPWEPLGIQCPA